MTKQRLRLVSPTTENRTVNLHRPKNSALRTREHLTIDEVERLIGAAENNRYGHRDALMVLLAFRHGLRAGEVVDLRWEQIDFKTATLHVRRLKNGTHSTHPLTGRELRALRHHQRESAKSPFVFVSERGAPLSAPGFSRMVERTAVSAKLGIRLTPTWFATPVATRSQMTGRIRAPSRPISGTGTFRTRSGTLHSHLIGSRGFGRTEDQK
jgi:integrase